MEELILALVVLGVIETSYLVYRSRPVSTIDKHSLLMDTSVLIDGRILPIARSGLVTAPLIIPRSVVRELQYMADKADHDKRERARAGLDMIEQLQQIEDLQVRLIDDPALKDGGVDERLVELAQAHGARLCTIDYNLNKAARVQGVVVVNINELAHALRIVHLPGETVELKLVQQGQESRQAVGYLDDGTMVVVDDAKAQIGHSVEVQVTRVLQTTAGKMMFARKVSSQKTSQKFSGQTASNASMVARNKTRTSKKFSSQTTSEASMVADNEAKNGSLQTSSEASITAIPDAKNASLQPAGKANTAQRNRRAPRMPQEKPRSAESQTVSRDPQQVSNETVARVPAQQNAPQPKRQQPQRRARKTPEDSFIDQLNKQQ